jgi:lysine 2,3-aminomutase
MRNNWIWQEQNAMNNPEQLSEYFKNIKREFFEKLFNENLSVKITPYILSQIPKNISKKELEKNPWFLQFFPLGEIYKNKVDSYKKGENWEKKEEFPTSNLHHKYTNRAVIRLDNCLGHCSFCFEFARVLEKDKLACKKFLWEDWKNSLKYFEKHSEIEEVILSGGEPLLLSDEKLDSVLSDIRKIKDSKGNPKIKFIRIHTRALTHNPFRITDNLCKIFKKNKVNCIFFNVAHSYEITQEFVNAVKKIRKNMGEDSPLLMAHTPLIKNLNADEKILWELFSKLYQNNIKPYYLLHMMPFCPYGDKQRTSVRRGVEIMKKLKRIKSNPALPEYILAHHDGKITIPLEVNGTPEFVYTKNKNGDKIIKFLNWKNKWVEYLDGKD